jgi:hypothetical protein
MGHPTIEWNREVQVVVADLDETLAGLYLPVTHELLAELDGLLRAGLVVVLATGQGIVSVWERLASLLTPVARQRLLAGCCTGAELWWFPGGGGPRRVDRSNPLEDGLHRRWRDLVGCLLEEFGLVSHPPTDVESFRRLTCRDPQAVMLADRGSQITLEMTNGGGLRDQIVARANGLFAHHDLPIEARCAATFAVDLVREGVSKAAVVATLQEHPALLDGLGVDPAWTTTPQLVEVWGDSFTPARGAIDLQISQGLHPETRSISFRDFDPASVPASSNVVAWTGRHRLEAGVLEYLLSRHKPGMAA